MPSIFGTALRFVAGAALATVLGGCATGNIWLPAPKAEAGKSGPEPDKASEEDRRIVARSGVIAKPELSEYVAGVGSTLAAVSDCPSMKWKFAVLDSPELRAFSTEAGYIYIDRGMIEVLNSKNDLAAVLAHEIAHTCTRDRQRRETVENIAFIGNLTAIGAIQPWALLSVFYVQVEAVTFLPAFATVGGWSRHEEFNADRHGAEYLRRAGYPPESMSAVMDVLQGIDAYQHAQQKSEGAYWRLMEGVYDKLAADHPTPKRRKAKLGHVETIRAAADPEFLAQLDGLDFGAEKKNGTSSGRKVYFAQWNLMLEVPEGWTTSMSPNKLWIFRRDGAVRMSLERVSVDTPIDLCEALLSYYSHGASLANLQRASENGVRSCAGLVNGNREALSLLGIVVRDDAPSAGYVFRGFHRKLAGSDPDFLSIARSIELPGEDRPKPPVVRIRTVGADDTFAALAKNARVPNAEAQLRLLNQRYPSGELVPGQLVKVIE